MFYGTATDFRNYHEARGRDMSDYAVDAAVESLLLTASEWLDGVFRTRFDGYKVDQREQDREWPRYGVVDRDGYYVDSESIPIEIERATYEAAYREGESAGALLRDYTPKEYRSIRIEGSIAVEYATVSAAMLQTQFPIIGQIMERLLGDVGNISPISSRTARA